MIRPPRHPAAFTLLEVLVACALVGLVATVLYASLHAAFKTRRSTVDQLAAARAARLALEMVGRDLHAALPPVGVLAGAFLAQDERDPRGRDADGVSFYNAADPLRMVESAGDVQHVSFALLAPSEAVASDLDAPSQAAGVLVRRVTRNLMAPVADTPVQQVLCRGVVSMNLRYFDGWQWLEEWDSTTRDNALPMAVEVTLELDPAGGKAMPDSDAYRLVRLFRLLCATPVPPESEEGLFPALLSP